jgi:glucosamine--fructose-6-phosphate aminotransferase (isomerizing)
MDARDTLMYQEAHESAAVVARQFAANEAVVGALAQSLRAQPPRFIVTCARGSSDHAAAYAKYVFETQLGIATASASPSVTSVYAAEQQWRGALFIAISQSGKSPDLLRNAQAAKIAGARVVALVNVEDSPLAALADTVIPLHAGPERSVAATKSYIAALAAVLHLCARWRGDVELGAALQALPDALRSGWDADWSALSEGLVHARNLFVVGRGYGLGIALEAALKFKETCDLPAEPFSGAEFMHGPVSLVDTHYPVLIFMPTDAAAKGLDELAADLRGKGGSVFVTGASGGLPAVAPEHPDADAICLIQSLYGLLVELAGRRGTNVDEPRHLRKVTRTR